MRYRSSRVRANRNDCSCQRLAARKSSSVVATNPMWFSANIWPARSPSSWFRRKHSLAAERASASRCWPRYRSVSSAARAPALGDSRAHRSVSWPQTERPVRAPRHHTHGRASRCAPAPAPGVDGRQERCRVAPPASPRPSVCRRRYHQYQFRSTASGAPRAGRVRWPT